MPNELIVFLSLVVILIAVSGIGFAAEHLIYKHLQRQAKKRQAAKDEADKQAIAKHMAYLAEVRRNKILDNLPPKRAAHHNLDPGLRPHPLHGRQSTGGVIEPWVIPPASMAYTPDTHGIGDTTGTDSDTRTAAVITTLSAPCAHGD